MDRQGFQRRFDSYSESEPLDHLEIADEFPGTVGPRGSNECVRGHLIRLCKSCAKTNQGGCCAGRSKSVEQQPRLQCGMRLRGVGNRCGVLKARSTTNQCPV